MILLGYLSLILIALYGLVIVIEFIISGNSRKFIIEGVILLIVILLVIGIGFFFSQPIYRDSAPRMLRAPDQTSDGVSPIWATAIMIICTVFGMLARQIFSHTGPTSLSSYVRPLVVSPIIFFPLIGTPGDFSIYFHAVDLLRNSCLSEWIFLERSV